MKELPKSVGKTFEAIKNLPPEISKPEILKMISGFTLSSTSWFSNINLNSILTIISSATVASLLTYFVMQGSNNKISGNTDNTSVHIDTTLVIDNTWADTINTGSAQLNPPITNKNLNELDFTEKLSELESDETSANYEKGSRNDLEEGQNRSQSIEAVKSTDRQRSWSPRNEKKSRQYESNGKTVNINTKLLRELKKRLLRVLKDQNTKKVGENGWTIISVGDFEFLAIDGIEIGLQNSLQLADIIDDYAIDAYPGRKIIIDKSFIAVGDFDNKYPSFYGFRGSVQGKMSDIENALSQLSK